ncbi:MAG: glycosyltransferase family 4 protein [Chloroherpetonaceae bacterium]|nr:glycosyltransferase family 4 protein [Chloroherpetonaceae bacterium]MDW8436555.1 glycosyltransferase family 4 protein [Chloroherpetonaceae bacterium]
MPSLKLLVIAYYFPPSGGAGVQRVLKFVKYLREFDVEPVVLTVKDGDFPTRDESLLSETPVGVKVFRSKIVEPYALYRKFTGKPPDAPVDVNNIPKPGEKRSFAERVAEFARSNFFIPDARIGWFPFATKEGLRIIAQERIDCLYSSSPPYTTALIAKRLATKTGLPWIAGFRDPWTGFLSTPIRYGLAKWLDERLERSVYERCDAMEVAWQGIAKDFQKKYPDIDSNKIIHIENGFDEADIPALSFPRNEAFTITYAGSMYGKRSPKPFLDAVKSLIEKGKVDPKKIKLKFVGRFGANLTPLFEDEGLRGVVETKPYVPHAESVKELLKSDALLLIVDDAQGSEEIVPGKVYEYIGAARPVITLALEGAIASLIRETNAGVVANFRNQAEIEAAILRYYEAFWNGERLWRGNPDVIKKYTRREATRKLAELVRAVCEKRAARLPTRDASEPVVDR